MAEKSLQFHLDKYNINPKLQNFLVKLIDFVKDKLDVDISYTQSYVRIDFPSGKKCMWIDTLKSGNALRFRFHDINEKRNENFKELQSYSNEIMEYESKEGDDFSTVLIKDPFDLKHSAFERFLKRKYYEYNSSYEDGVEVENIKQRFFNKLGDENSISNYQKAYIILLLKSFFELTNKNGQANFDEICEYLRQFYLDREEKDYQIESKRINKVMKNMNSSTKNDFKQVIKDNPLNTKTLKEFFELHNDILKINKALWYQFTRDEICQVRIILNKQLSNYFNERVDGDSMAIPNVNREEIEKALHEFDEKLRDNDRWINFTEKKNHKYAIKYDGNSYPVKKTISMASGAHVSTFSGGEEANDYIKSKGFEIVEIDTGESIQLENKLKDKFKKVMKNYVEARRHEEFAGHELGDLLRKELPKIVNEYITDFEGINSDEYVVKGSIGQGKWAKVPWLAAFDKSITTTTQEGVYVVYLFSKDMNKLYLTLNQGVTNTSDDKLIETRDKLREEMEITLNTDNNINLSDSGIGSSYEDSTIGYIEYKKEDLPEEEDLIEDLETVINLYKRYKTKYIENRVTFDNIEDKVKYIKRYIESLGFNYPDGLIENFYLSLKTKPFVLLAGISGTGKTKLVKLFAKALGCTTDNGRFKLIPVKPDWSDGSDLLGYNDLKSKFQPGPMIDIIKKASENKENPYFICLDEMNLARVEYYFSDFLSIMESREKRGDLIKTDKLLEKTDFSKDVDKEKYAGLRIPDNLYIVGTVNMDETTHPFSKKVLDRANTIEFSEVSLTEFHLKDKENTHQTLENVTNQFLKPHYITLNDCNKENKKFITRVIDELQKVNNILKKANLHVGYRVRDEITFYMLYNKRNDLLNFNEAFDFQIIQKILPRIQGSSSVINQVLRDLFELAASNYHFEEKINVGDEAIEYVEENRVSPYTRTAKKLAYMIKRLEEDRFTAYWL